MRFLHTSDWHLGRIFHGLHMTDDQAVVLEELITLAKDSQVDAVLIAGDIYDRAVPPTQAVTLLDEVLRRLVQDAGKNVIMIAGNHDNADRLGFGQSLLSQNKLYITGPVSAATQPVVLYDEHGPVYFAPLTYGEPLAASELLGESLKTHEDVVRRQIRSQLEQIPAAARKVALAHVFLTGAQESPDSERPLAIGGATTVGIDCFAPFHYAALGHLHACQSGSSKVRYSGSLLKYSFNEVAQPKGVHLVDLAADGSITVETIPLSPRRELACLRGSFAELVSHPQTALYDHYLQVTLTDDQPVLDAKYKLEQVYPHILHLEYARLHAGTDTSAAAVSHKKLGTAELFEAFFTQVNDRPLNAAEKSLLSDVINSDVQAERQA